MRPDGNALLLAEDNEGERWCPTDEAVISQRAFAVEVAPCTLAIDSDNPGLRAELTQMAEQCRSAGLVPVVVASGQPGHLHLFARVSNPQLQHRLSDETRRLGLDVRRSIRPPLAPHRLSLTPALIEPINAEAALNALKATPLSRARRLSRRMEALLHDGDLHGRYHSRSEVVQALALAAVNAGWPFERLLWALCDGRNAGGAKVQEIAGLSGESGARRYVLKSWHKAQGHARTQPVQDRTEARAAIAHILAQAERCPWSGMAGATNRAVLQAHIEIAHKKGSLVYGASVRQVAERAGVSWPTAHTAHKRLAAARWLRCVNRSRPGRDSGATTWRLCVGQPRRSLTLSISSGGCVDEC
jgi:hypothetical protein